jgi:hypothetical protein
MVFRMLLLLLSVLMPATSHALDARGIRHHALYLFDPFMPIPVLRGPTAAR